MDTLTSVPNVLTIMRILLIPILIIAYYVPFNGSHLFASGIFAIACLTDWLDGFLARRLKLISPFGTFLDPVADKLLVSTSLLLIIGVKQTHYLTIPAIIIVGREIVISALREWMAKIGKPSSVTVSFIGKVKTTLQMMALLLLLAFAPSNNYLGWLGFILLYGAAFLTIWSMVLYLSFAWPQLKNKEILKSTILEKKRLNK